MDDNVGVVLGDPHERRAGADDDVVAMCADRGDAAQTLRWQGIISVLRSHRAHTYRS